MKDLLSKVLHGDTGCSRCFGRDLLQLQVASDGEAGTGIVTATHLHHPINSHSRGC